MEDLILKCAEFGILGIVTLLLLSKGLSSLNDLAKTTAMLSDSQKILAESIAKLAEKVSAMDTRLSNVAFQIEGIDKRLDKLEETYARNSTELRELIKGKSKRNGD